jgi:ABC-type transport system involved in multi-copper enzyme maturation permease subunit
MLFGALIFEREPLHWELFPLYLIYWVQVFGAFAAVGGLLWIIFGLPRMRAIDYASIPRWKSIVFSICAIVAALAYTPMLILYTNDFIAAVRAVARNVPVTGRSPDQQRAFFQVEFLCLTVGGVAALVGVLLPFFSSMTRLRFRRVFAIAKLSFKEAVRRRVLYAFALLLLVFLFGTWFVRTKSEDQVRTYVKLVNFAMAVLLLFAAVILSAFSIPSDMRQQTIHTITTKPVERFEIVLGRFLGFTALMTVVLAVMSSLCLLYVLREINPEAARESLKARAPLYGNLVYENTQSKTRGENVGAEWEYRGYIGYAPSNPPTAVWTFPMPPAALGARKQVPCEFTFFVYRTTKGEENKGVSCRLVFETAAFQPGNAQAYNNLLDKKLYYKTQSPDKIKEDLRQDPELNRDAAKLEARLSEELKDKDRPLEDIKNELCAKYGYYESTIQLKGNAKVDALPVPGGLFANARQTGPKQGAAPLTVRVTCVSPTQYVGMARYDLYFRMDDESAGRDRFWFAVNFFKGAFGLWLRLCLIIGIAVALSTYLSGVISLLIAGLLFLGGESREYIQQVATGHDSAGRPVAGGGPFESFYRVGTRTNLVTNLDNSTLATAAKIGDVAFYRPVIRRVFDVIPDTQRLTLTPYVAEGFNISLDQMGLLLLVLLGYLFPCAVLAYYLIEWREIAGPM